LGAMESASASGSSGTGDGLEARRNQRALRLLFATGAIMLALGLGWSVVFFSQGAGLVALTEVALALLGIAVISAARLCHVRLASWMAFLGLFAFVCLFSARLDVHTGDIPRTTHLFLLVLAGAAHHVFRSERPWLRYGCVCLFLGAFVVFAAMPEGVPARYAIPDELRRVGIWFNLLTVVACLLVVMHLQESDSAAHRALHRSLRDALAARRFVLFYQPQIDASGRIVGAEALLRWHDPRRGLVPPAEFVQAAEDTGFILPLGQWVLAEACRQLQVWECDPRLRDVRLSVNVSGLQLRQPDFAAQVLDILARTDVAPDRLALELTESVLVHDVAEAAASMRALGAAGVRLSLDDFGTGYASLSSLRRLPFSELKIDRAFVAEVVRDAHAASITRNLLQLGIDLGLDVIAEGIEDAAQFAFLQGQGCRLFQGYLFGRPMPVAAFETLVRDAAPAPAPAFT
jgi:EAL domain-containing protein (putative c-di-GMP-specific phosphodiesterase class I)